MEGQKKNLFRNKIRKEEQKEIYFAIKKKVLKIKKKFYKIVKHIIKIIIYSFIIELI